MIEVLSNRIPGKNINLVLSNISVEASLEHYASCVTKSVEEAV